MGVMRIGAVLLLAACGSAHHRGASDLGGADGAEMADLRVSHDLRQPPADLTTTGQDAAAQDLARAADLAQQADLTPMCALIPSCAEMLLPNGTLCCNAAQCINGACWSTTGGPCDNVTGPACYGAGAFCGTDGRCH